MNRARALVLIGGPTPSAPLMWATVDDSGAVVSHGEDSAAQPPRAAPEHTILIVPGADVQVKQVELPARTDAQARAAAPMLFESALAATEGVHYAIGPAQNADGLRLVAAIAQTRLDQWLARCRAASADPYLVVADFSLWPVARGEVHIVEASDRVMIAAGEAGGFSIEAELAPGVFSRWAAQARQRFATLVLAENGAAKDWAALPGASVRAISAPDAGRVLAEAALDPPGYTPNLRQGVAADATETQSRFRVWRFAAALALLAALLQIGALVGQGLQDRRAARATLAQAEEAFRAARPDVGRVVNLRAQTTALINAMEQAENHPVLAATDPLIRALQTQPLARVDEVRFEAPGRTVRLRLSAPQPTALEAAATALRDQGVQVETRDMQPTDGRYAAELIIEAPT